jgi:hypothetical protein
MEVLISIIVIPENAIPGGQDVKIAVVIQVTGGHVPREGALDRCDQMTGESLVSVVFQPLDIRPVTHQQVPITIVIHVGEIEAEAHIRRDHVFDEGLAVFRVFPPGQFVRV